MTHPGHPPHPTPRTSHTDDEDDNPNHLPVDPDQGPFADELPADGPSEGGTEPRA